MDAKTGKGMWGAMAGIAALLLLALAVPVAAKQRFHLRVERERRAARSAMAGIAGRTLPAFDPEVAEAAGRFRFRGIFPFRSGYSNHFEPPTEGECAAIRAWCATNPAAVALFERLSAPTSAAPAAAAGPVDEAALWRQRHWLWLDLPLFARALLEEAVARGDAATAEDLDRRLRALGLLGAELVLAGQCEGFRLGAFPLTLPLFSDAYLDEIDRYARDGLKQAGAGVAAFLPAYLEAAEQEDAADLPLPDGTVVRRFAARVGRDIAKGNRYRIIANAPRALDELDSIRLAPSPGMYALLVKPYYILHAGEIREWPSFHPVFSEEWSVYSFPLRYAERFHNRLCFECAAIAIERFRRRTGSLPERLEDLPDDLPRMLPTGLLPEHRRGTFRVPGFRRPKSEEELNRRFARAEEETSLAFDDPDYEEEEPPSLRVRGYMLAVRAPPYTANTFDIHDCPFEDKDCFGCILLGTLAPDDDTEPDTAWPPGPAAPLPSPPSEF